MSAQSQPNRAKAQHRLAQFYLRLWANPDGGINAQFRDGHQITTGSEALAVGSDFFTITREDGTKDSLVEERFLRAWDGRGADLIGKLLAEQFPLSDDDRTTFGLFLGLQWLRGIHARRVSEEFHDLFTKLVVTAGLEQAPLPEDSAEADQDRADGSIAVPSLGHLPEELKEILRDWDAYEFPLPQEQAIGQMVRGMPDAASYFLDAEWLLFRFCDHSLFSSDEPLVLGRDEDPAPQALGLGNADVVLFPLSPTYCLAMNRANPTGLENILPGTPVLADEFNALQVHNGWWQQLYRHPEGPPFPSPPSLPERRVILG
jgi:hypothetical protein